jgi:hypothetical protein
MDKATAKKYYESFLAEIVAFEERSDRALRRNLSLTSQNLLGLSDEMIDGNVEAAAAYFNEDHQKKILAAYSRLKPLSHILFYANLNYRLFLAEVVANAGAELATKITEGRRLQKMGHHWLTLLAGMGVISQKTLQSILEGEGDDDTAGDCQQSGEILDDKFVYIAQTAPNHPDPELKMTRADVRRMAELGTELIELIQQAGNTVPEGETDWSDRVQVIYAMLEKDFHVVRTALSFLFDYEKRQEEAARLVTSLWTLGAAARRPSRKPADPGKRKAEETKPVDEKKPAEAETTEPGE